MPFSVIDSDDAFIKIDIGSPEGAYFVVPHATAVIQSEHERVFICQTKISGIIGMWYI